MTPDNQPREKRSMASMAWPTILGIAAVFAVLAMLMLIRSGHDDSSSPKEIMTRPTPSGR
jgi:hypothetical protein